MHEPILIAIAVVVIAVLTAGGFVWSGMRREHRRADREDAVAKAALEYFTRFGVEARIVGATLGNGKIALMIETKPHKKLRFSYIIEQPIRQHIEKLTGIEVDRVFWRFPVAEKKDKVPDVQYGIPTTVMLPTASMAPPTQAAAASTQDKQAEEEDEYFLGQNYHIEEVAWNEFSSANEADQKNASA